MKEIVERHIVGGDVVERLRMPDEDRAVDGPDASVQTILEGLPIGRPQAGSGEKWVSIVFNLYIMWQHIPP